MADLKIALRDLFALHSASLDLEHGIRESGGRTPWQEFNPTRFVYAFFTFNSVYAWDWSRSFPANEPLEWEPMIKADGSSRRKSETEQFSGLVDYYHTALGADAATVFAASLNRIINLLGISDPEDKLTRINVINETKDARKYRKRFLDNFETIRQPEASSGDPKKALTEVLWFIYLVRCNIFHGRKKTIEMEDDEQQARLLIYAAILIATNGMLFEVADRAGIGWITPRVNWKTRANAVEVADLVSARK